MTEKLLTGTLSLNTKKKKKKKKIYGRSLFAADLYREVVIYWRNYVHSLRRAKHVQQQCGYVNWLNSGVTGP